MLHSGLEVASPIRCAARPFLQSATIFPVKHSPGSLPMTLLLWKRELSSKLDGLSARFPSYKSLVFDESRTRGQGCGLLELTQQTALAGTLWKCGETLPSTGNPMTQSCSNEVQMQIFGGQGVCDGRNLHTSRRDTFWVAGGRRRKFRIKLIWLFMRGNRWLCEANLVCRRNHTLLPCTYLYHGADDRLCHRP